MLLRLAVLILRIPIKNPVKIELNGLTFSILTSLIIFTTLHVVADEVSTSMVFWVQLARILCCAGLVPRRTIRKSRKPFFPWSHAIVIPCAARFTLLSSFCSNSMGNEQSGSGGTGNDKDILKYCRIDTNPILTRTSGSGQSYWSLHHAQTPHESLSVFITDQNHQYLDQFAKVLFLYTPLPPYC